MIQSFEISGRTKHFYCIRSIDRAVNIAFRIWRVQSFACPETRYRQAFGHMFTGMPIDEIAMFAFGNIVPYRQKCSALHPHTHSPSSFIYGASPVMVGGKLLDSPEPLLHHKE